MPTTPAERVVTRSSSSTCHALAMAVTVKGNNPPRQLKRGTHLQLLRHVPHNGYANQAEREQPPRRQPDERRTRSSSSTCHAIASPSRSGSLASTSRAGLESCMHKTKASGKHACYRMPPAG